MAVIGDFLRSLRQQRTRASSQQTLGHAGTPVYSGYIQTVEDNSDLTGQAKFKTFSELLANTSIIAAGTRQFLNLLTKADWKVEPAEVGGRRAEEIAKSVESILMKRLETPWFRVVRRAAMARFYGFSIQEWTSQRIDGSTIGFKDIAPRSQKSIERWDIEIDGSVLGVIQRSPQTNQEIYLPRWKLVYLVDDTLNDSPEGLGLFRHVAEVGRRLSRFEQLEGYGFELDLRGVPVGRAPLSKLQEMIDNQEMTQADADAITLPMRTFLKNHVMAPKRSLLIDSMVYESEDEAQRPSGTPQWDISLLQGSNTTQDAIARAIERINREIARTLGVEHLLLGGDGTGSLAMSRDKSENFALLVAATLREIRLQFDRDLIQPLMVMNGWPEELRPELKTEAVQHRSIEEITSALRDMAAAGAILDPDDPAIAEVRELLGLSKPETINLAADALGGGEEQDPERVEDDDTEENNG